MTKSVRNWGISVAVVLIALLGGYFYLSHSSPLKAGSSPSSHEQTQHNFITVKYRATQVDVADSRFEYLDTSRSSFVQGAWYDSSNEYMIINLSGTNYHYCGMPSSVWQEFKSASSFGTYYNSDIKGNFDCRENPVPDYGQN